MTRTRRGARSRWWPVVAVAVVVMTVVPVVVYGLMGDDDADGAAGPASGLASDATPAPDDSATEREQAKPPSALLFGDSYFIGDFNQTDTTNSMAALAAERLGYEEIVVRGGGGTGFVQANPDFDLPPYYQQIKAGALGGADPDLLVIEGGSNDAGEPKWKVRRNAGLVLDLARETHPDAMLISVGPLDVDGNFSETTPIHKAIRKAATDRGIPYIDMRRWLKGHYDLVGPDFVHPTAKGHRLLGRKLARALAALGA